MTTKIMTPYARCSWVFVHGEGNPNAEGESKYGMTLMLPKNKEALASLGLNPAQRDTILANVRKFVKDFTASCAEIAKAKFGGSYTSSRWNPIIDGDEKTETFDGNKNFWLLRTKTKFQPKVARPKSSDGYIADGDEDTKDGFYSGAWARAYITPFAYQVSGNKGVALGLGGIQKVYNDEPFAQGGDVFADDIEDIDDSDSENFSDATSVEDLV